MRSKIAGWVKKKSAPSALSFVPAEVEESVEELDNPACGMYQMFTLAVEQEPDIKELQWCMGRSLVLVFFQIGHYRKRPLDEAALQHMERVLDELSRNNKDVILRIAYDNTGKGLEHEPETLDRILGHMEQMSPLLHKYASCIYIVQGLFVGSWGEMHTSRHLSTAKLARLEQKLRNCLGEGTYMAFRRPMQYRRIHKTVEPNAATGIFDDGILGSRENLGTFGTQSQRQSGWEGSWNREEELQFLSELARYAPVGGEAVLGSSARYPWTFSDTLGLLAGMNVSYLNSAYDVRVHSAWEKMVFPHRGAWKGMNGKDYIFRHVGYRYRVKAVHCSLCQDMLSLSITIKNDGFSRAYQPVRPYIQIGGERSYFEKDLQELGPGEECVLKTFAACSSGEILLGASRMKDMREVLFANTPVSTGQILLGTVR